MTKNSTTTVYLSLGSNRGDRMAHLAAAEEKLANHPDIRIVKKSSVYETEPWPLHDVEEKTSRNHPESESGNLWFLNQVIQIETGLGPQEFLEAVQKIETSIGRTAKHHWGPREIDIDILLYGTAIIDAPELTIPHRHMNDRQFVLVPLLEIEPHLKDPVSGKAYRAILDEVKDDHKVEKFF